MKPRVFAQVYLLLQGFSRGHGGVNTGVGGQQGLTPTTQLPVILPSPPLTFLQKYPTMLDYLLQNSAREAVI